MKMKKVLALAGVMAFSMAACGAKGEGGEEKTEDGKKRVCFVARIDVKNIVTHEFDLEHIQDAYDEAVKNKIDLVKAVIKVK